MVAESVFMKKQLLSSLGSFVARTTALERGVVWLGHHLPKAPLVASLCYHTAEQAFLREPTRVRTASLWNGSQLRVTLEEHAFRHIYYYGMYEPEVTMVIKHLARPGQCWFDVGGNVGYYSVLLSALVGDTGQVHVFEPNPAVANAIESSLGVNRAANVRLVRKAVSDNSEACVALYVPPDDSGRTSLIKHHDIKSPSMIEVPTTSLDDYAAETGAAVEFMKIDIEGHELAAFQGMTRTLSEAPPRVIICEATHCVDALATPAELIRYVIQYGYIAYRLRADGLFPFREGDDLHWALDKDIVFVQPDSVALVQGVMRKA